MNLANKTVVCVSYICHSFFNKTKYTHAFVMISDSPFLHSFSYSYLVASYTLSFVMQFLKNHTDACIYGSKQHDNRKCKVIYVD